MNSHTITTNTRELVGMTTSDWIKDRCRWAYAVEALVTCHGEEIEVSAETLTGLRLEVERLDAVITMLETIQENLDRATITWPDDTRPVVAPGGQCLDTEDIMTQIYSGVAADEQQQRCDREVYERAADRIEWMLSEAAH